MSENSNCQSSGGMGQGDVWACRPCNRLKGPTTVEEFRDRLADVLGREISFAGEKKGDCPVGTLDSTEVQRAQAILGAQRVLKLTGPLAGELLDAVMFLRTHGQATLTLSAIAHEAISRELTRLADLHNDGQPFPHFERPHQLGLFAASESDLTERSISRVKDGPKQGVGASESVGD